MNKVYFDECGNTGQNLIDVADPTFVLGSCSFGVDDEQELLAFFREFQGPELKFSKLRKTGSGQRSILAFLKSNHVSSTTSASYVFHKPFMVVTKYCDIILEPSFREFGHNFYARGANIAIANLLAATMPIYLNPTTWNNFLSAFVFMVRERTAQSFDAWRLSAELIFNYLEGKERTLASFIVPALMLNDCQVLFSRMTPDEMDPLVPAYHTLADHWGRTLGGPYEIIADENKVLVTEQGRLLKFSDPSLKTFSAGFDRRKVEFPLKVSNIKAVESHKYLQVQFADIICGAVQYATKVKVKRSLQPGTFAQEVLDLCIAKELIVGGVWPGNEVTPKELGTDAEPRPGEIDAATYASMIMKSHPLTKDI